MNLVVDPWIPVLPSNAEKTLVSLEQLFGEGDRICDLAVNPVQRIALTRLLICITQAALDGPQDEEDWFHCASRIPDAALTYLHKWQDRFELYGENAFLQARQLQPLHNATLDKLDFGLAAGNNATLFDHGACPEGRSHSRPWCALELLTYQCFSPGGRIGETKWSGEATTGTSEHAPAVAGSALHAILVGDVVIETLWLNLITKELVDSLPNMSFGRPVWEMEALPSVAGSAGGTRSYLGRLVPLSRAIALHQSVSNMTLANGVSYPKLPDQREAMATVVRRGKGAKERDMYVAVNLSRHPWRELASLVTLPTREAVGGPLALKHLAFLEEDPTLDVWTGGMAADKGKILDVAEWRFSLPVSLLATESLHRYETGVDLARDAEGVLRAAIKTCHTDLHVDAKQIPYETAQVHYWSSLDNRFGALVEAASTPAAELNTAWYPIVRAAMEDAYAHACPHTTPRQIQAFAHGRQKLRLQKLQER